MKQVTLISLYGHKHKSLCQLIRDCAEIIHRSPLRRVFRPYHQNQVHGTIVGMEKLVGHTDHFNANVWLATGKKVPMDFVPLLPTLRKHLPMTVQFGGFKPAFNTFDSFGHWPYERSFQVQWPTKRFTVIGWPHDQGQFKPRRLLQDLRDDLGATCSIRHKWGADNDFFMVLGEIINVELLTDSELSQLRHAASAVEAEVRDYLADHKVEVMIDADEVCLAQYETETLSLDSTMPHRISNASITPSFVAGLYA